MVSIVRSLISQSGHFPGFVNVENEVATFWLFLGSLGLLLTRWWSLVVAIILGGKVFYSPGYLSLWIYANAEGGSPSLQTGRVGFTLP